MTASNLDEKLWVMKFVMHKTTLSLFSSPQQRRTPSDLPLDTQKAIDEARNYSQAIDNLTDPRLLICVWLQHVLPYAGRAFAVIAVSAVSVVSFSSAAAALIVLHRAASSP